MSAKTEMLATMLREVGIWATRQQVDPYYEMARALRSSNWMHESDENKTAISIENIVLNDAEDPSDKVECTDLREVVAWLQTHNGRAVIARDSVGRKVVIHADVRIAGEYAVDHRDQPPMFACIVAHPDKSSAAAAARRAARPLLRREITDIRITGDWREE